MSAENTYKKLNASELSAIILKGSSTSQDRDAGFCSGSSEGDDDLSMDHSRLEPRSPTDASEDSIEVKVTPISFTRNKRKSSEPSRVVFEQDSGPLKKRIRYASGSSCVDADNKSHFRPWNHNEVLHGSIHNPAEILIRHPGVTTLHRVPVEYDAIQEEPLALVAKKPSSSASSATKDKNSSLKLHAQSSNHLKNDLNCIHPGCSDLDIPLTIHGKEVPSVNNMSSSSSTSSQRPQQRNYKNMTRERRIEANARERTRVHTISAAYDTLRKAIPSYSHSQKLSKLSVLRVACSYILTLSRMAGKDYSEDQSAPSLSSCFEMVTKTIQTEGKIRKKKDE